MIVAFIVAFCVVFAFIFINIGDALVVFIISNFAVFVLFESLSSTISGTIVVFFTFLKFSIFTSTIVLL